MNEGASGGRSGLIRQDFDGSLPSDLKDGWFRLQKLLLDRLHVALQIDLARF